MNPPLGFAAAVGGSTISALASVYFEKILKGSVNPTSLWVRNVQLAFYSLFPALFIGVFYVDGERVAHDGFFAGYNWVVWTTVVFQAIGGILVSLCINYADNITKNFAISISILIGLCVSVWVFKFTVTANFFVGTCAVLSATYLYSNGGRGGRASPIRIHDYEKTTIDPRPARGKDSPLKLPATPVKSEGSLDCVPFLRTQVMDLQNPHHGFDEALLDDFDRALLEENRATETVQTHHPINRTPIQSWSRGSHPLLTNPFEGIEELSLRPSLQTSFQPRPEGSSSSVEMPSSPLVGVSKRRRDHSYKDDGQHHFHNCRRYPSRADQGAISRDQKESLAFEHGLPVVQGIPLIPSSTLPDRFRAIFPFRVFNVIQSKCFGIVYKSTDNLVLSAPTGSGKTVALELAICQLIGAFKLDQYKIVYMAPTKALCAERHRDWRPKFALLNLQCAELTGDTDQGQLRNVQNAEIIITTPEKWDSITRKWKDHARLMKLVKLFLIDEVHILKDTRGACLEAVVSRMKSVGSGVRFVALSATIPNSEDIAIWLGKNTATQHLPAHQERFGEEFRPVKLRKYVYGLPYSGSDFGFDNVCNPKLSDIIAKHSRRRPIIIFCITRKSTIVTAKLLANLWTTKSPTNRPWLGPNFRVAVQDLDLKVKNTVCFQDEGLKEYADLEMMQMLGRAGRPQFDDNAVAVIMTKQEKVLKYEKMASGEEVLESWYQNVEADVFMQNAEVCLGTVCDLYTAKMWLSGTFLSVRLRLNPEYYRLEGDSTDLGLDDRLQRICQRGIDVLLDIGVVTLSDKLRCTAFGDAMARYYVNFKTMEKILALKPRSRASDILSALVEAEEFRDVRFRGAEKRLLKAINAASGIKFPLKVDIALPTHKRSLIIQAELGGVDFPVDEQYVKFKRQYNQDRALIFQHVHRLIRCIIDCQIHLQDAFAVRHALELARSFSAGVWDNSPHEMKQVPQIGSVAVRKLASRGISSIEALEAAEPHRIEMLLSKNPPFGSRVLASLKDFPKLRVSVKMMGKDTKRDQPVKIKVRAECGFMNEKPPVFFHRTPIYVCFLAERSDGLLIDFRRISAKQLGNGQDILISVDLTQYTQYVICYVMCDEIAGTLRCAELKPDIPMSMFAMPSVQIEDHDPKNPQTLERGMPWSGTKSASLEASLGDDKIYDDGVDDQDFSDAGMNFCERLIGRRAMSDLQSVRNIEFQPIDAFERDHPGNRASTDRVLTVPAIFGRRADPERKAIQLANGNWACNHKCKDKLGCKHLCCHEGVDRPPKPPKQPTTAPVPQPKKKLETLDLTVSQDSNDYAKFAQHDYKKLDHLHHNTAKGVTDPARNLRKPSSSYKERNGSRSNSSSAKRGELPQQDESSSLCK
ncbi:MAG: hypothetical protein Q9214_002586, partial [Letrouitia sp. 1 TL-2023]